MLDSAMSIRAARLRLAIARWLAETRGGRDGRVFAVSLSDWHARAGFSRRARPTQAAI